MNNRTDLIYNIIGIVFAVLVIGFITISKINDVKVQNFDELKTIAQVEKDIRCMALNIYREAGYEPVNGRIAVGQVTMNRVNHPDFPNTVCEVVYQKTFLMSRVICQFSWYCDATHYNRPVNPRAYAESYEIAKKVILEDLKLEKLDEALFYHADYVNPRWKLKKIDQIGTHIFYRKGEDHAKLAGI